MSIITLISDWGNLDYYAAVVKASIYRMLPGAQVVDITHNITPFSSSQAAYVLRNAYRHFPEGTVHLIGVNTEESDDEPHTVVFADGHYFIGTDNGVFSLLFDSEPEKIFTLDIPQDSDSFTFSSLNRFVIAAVHLAEGKSPEELGAVRNDMKKMLLMEPICDANCIRGNIMYVDNYGNLLTNISRKLFYEFVGKKPFRISVRGAEIDEIIEAYGDLDDGGLGALFSANNMLEIAIKHGEAASLLGLNIEDVVIVERLNGMD